MKRSYVIASIVHSSLKSIVFTLSSLCIVLTFSSLVFAQTPEENPTVVTTTRAVERAKSDAESVKAKSVIRGRAVYDDTERPIRRARVSLLTLKGNSNTQTVKTNGRGEFEITNVPAGSYFVMVDAIGVMTPVSFVDATEVGREKFNLDEIRKYFTEVVVNGENAVTIKVRARRGGAVSGKVTYSDGDPAIGVRITITRKMDGKMARFITNLDPMLLMGIRTDDRGMFRIAGLPPGEYNLAASEVVNHGNGRSQPEDYLPFSSFVDASLLVTYYPGTTKLEDAAAIQVNAGQEHNELNISLVERVLYKIAGTVQAKRDRKPLAQAQIVFRRKGESAGNPLYGETGTTITTDESGRFEFNEIPDGDYTLTVTSDPSPPNYEDTEVEDAQAVPSPARPEPPRKLSRRQQDVKIDGSDQTDLTIMLSDGATVSGILSMDTAGPIPRNLFVSLVDTEGGSPSEVSGRLSSDGSFLIEEVSPATAFVMVDILRTEEPSYIKSMTSSNGADLTREPMLIPEGADIHGVRIVMSADVGIMNGQVVTSQGAPVRSVRFMVVPVDPTRWRSPARRMLVETDVEGGYEIKGAPGDYLAILMAAGDTVRSINEAWIRERATGAQRVTLVAKQTRKVDLVAPAQ